MLYSKLIVTVLILCFSFVLLNSEEIWKITSLDWQPYSGSNMINHGSSIQKLRNKLQKEGITLQVDFFPWKRSQQLAKTEAYIGYFPAWPEEVTVGFIASNPIDWSEIGILKKKGTVLTFTNLNELFSKYKVGIVDYQYPAEVVNASKKYPSHTEVSSNEVAMMKKLSIGRIDAAITDPNVTLYLAQAEGIDNLEVVKIIMKKRLVIALRNDAENKKRIERINKIFENIKD